MSKACWWMVLGVAALLAQEAAAQTPVGRRCTTHEHRIRVRNVVFSNLDRPSKPDVLVSTVQPISLHFDGRVVSQAKAARVLSTAEEAWDVEITQLGWAAPLPDQDFGGNGNLDIYLDDLGDGSAYTAPDAEDPGLTRDAAMSFIVLDQDIPDVDIPFFVFHELNHASQFALDAGESDAVFEWTASFVEYLTQPDAVAQTGYLPAFNGSPQDALDDFTHRDEYEYGASLFLFFVVQRYFNNANELVKDLWVGSAQRSTGAAYVNEPDFMDVLETRLAPQATLLDVYGEFSRWRSFVGDDDDGQHIQLPGLVPFGSEMAVDTTLGWTALPASRTVDIAETGSVRLNVEGAAPAGRALRAAAADGAADDVLELSVLMVDANNAVLAQQHARGLAPVVTVNIPAGARARVLLARLGDGSHDPDDQEWSANSYGLTLESVEAVVEVPDAGMAQPLPPDEKKPGPCACANATTHAATVWWMGVILVVGLRRRAPSHGGGASRSRGP